MNTDTLSTDSGTVEDGVTIAQIDQALRPVEVMEPSAIQELTLLSRQGREIFKGFVQLNDNLLNARDIVGHLQHMSHEGRLNQDMLDVSTVALESCLAGTGIRMTGPLKLSHFEGGNQLAMEGLYDVAKSIYDGGGAVISGVLDATKVVYRFVKKKLVLLARHVVKLMGAFARSERGLEEKIRDIERELGRVKRKDPLVPFIKAESWCEYLCYTKRPFIKGLEGIHHEVDLLVNEHAKMGSMAIQKYVDVLKDMSGARDSTQTLRVGTKEFLLPGMKEFYRSVGLKEPRGDNIFFQSHELPGGRAFYTQVNPVDQTQAAAVDMLDDVDFMIALHDPRSYDLFKMKLAAAVAMPLSVFLVAINPLLGAAATTATAAYIATRGVDGTGSEVTIDKSTIFECLTLDEVHKRVQEMREGLKSLRAWGQAILHEPWKRAEIDELVYGICDGEETTGNMKSFCGAVISLMNRLTMDVSAYAFKVYNAMGNFCLKSLKQYR